MNARITMIGGGSYHWAPRLLSDFANTPSLEDAEVVLHDLDMSKVGEMVAYGEQIAQQRDIKLAVRAEGDRKKALQGAEFVVSAFSVGGFDSMRHDLEIPARYGIRQPIGDSIGPGGVMRALRSIPVVLGFGRDAAEVCPNALFMNVSNPLSALTRTVARETGMRTVGLCNELIGCSFVLSLLTDAPMHTIDPIVAGVNHFPMIVALRMGEEDGFAKVREVLDDLDGRGAEPIWMPPPEPMHWTKFSDGEQWTKADVVANTPVKLELFRRFGVMPGAHDHHVVEFMPGFVNDLNEHGENWRIHHYGLSGHMEDADDDVREFEERVASAEVTRFPSGELVANLIDGVVTGKARALPMNLPNTGQIPDLPPGVIVEAMGIADGDGVRPRDEATVGGILGEYVRRTVVAQELTVDAGILGDRTLAFEAMLADPIAGRLPYEAAAAMTGEMLDALEPWLPQF
ncbi:MAG TPA: hypothetical protein VGO03_07285 [Acidimicrobiia bacterium]|jgi:alpha-galactosidase